MFEAVKLELPVKSVCIRGSEQPAAKSLQIGLRNERFHQPLAQTFAAVFFDDKDVADIGERRLVCNDTGESDLLTAAVNAEAERVFDSCQRLLHCAALRPIGFFRQKMVDRTQVEPPLVRVDLVLAFSLFHLAEEIV